MNTGVVDATDMSCFADNSFDIVLNRGPFLSASILCSALDGF